MFIMKENVKENPEEFICLSPTQAKARNPPQIFSFVILSVQMVLLLLDQGRSSSGGAGDLANQAISRLKHPRDSDS